MEEKPSLISRFATDRAISSDEDLEIISVETTKPLCMMNQDEIKDLIAEAIDHCWPKGIRQASLCAEGGLWVSVKRTAKEKFA